MVRPHPPTPRERAARARTQARWTGAAGFLAAAVLPFLLFGNTIRAVASGFRFELDYLVTGWSPWVLMVLGLLCFVPVAVADLRDRERRFHRNGTGAWAGWGVTLYLLGFALATQVTQIAGALSA